MRLRFLFFLMYRSLKDATDIGSLFLGTFYLGTLWRWRGNGTVDYEMIRL